MNIKNVFKSLAFAMLMPAMLFTTSCGNEDEVINGGDAAKQGYKIPVTVNVTRQGDKANTRAEYNESTRKLSFSAGDKLFVKGNDDRAGGVGAGYFAGTLEYVDGSEGTFSGTINCVVSSYTGTIDDAFANGAAEATLLPAGWDSEDYNYIYFNNPDTWYTEILFNYYCAIAGDLATAVEQFSHECGTYTSGTGFALAPQNAIVNCSYKSPSDISEGEECYPYLYDGNDFYGSYRDIYFGANNIIQFAIAVPGNLGEKTWTLCDDWGNFDDIDLGEKNLVAGHIYNWRNYTPAPVLKSETISINNTSGTYTGTNFTLTATDADEDEELGGGTYYYAYIYDDGFGSEGTVTISSTDKEIVKVELIWGDIWSLTGLTATNGTFTNNTLLEDVNATSTTISCPNNGGAQLLGVKVYYYDSEASPSQSQLLSLTVADPNNEVGGAKTIYYAAGETWGEAIANHTDENSGWYIDDEDYPTYTGAGFQVSVYDENEIVNKYPNKDVIIDATHTYIFN